MYNKKIIWKKSFFLYNKVNSKIALTRNKIGLVCRSEQRIRPSLRWGQRLSGQRLLTRSTKRYVRPSARAPGASTAVGPLRGSLSGEGLKASAQLGAAVEPQRSPTRSYRVYPHLSTKSEIHRLNKIVPEKQGDFIELQRMSFFSLLEKGIREELIRLGPIKLNNNLIQNRHPINDLFELIFDPSTLYFEKPHYSTSKALSQRRTYAIKTHIRAKFIYGSNLIEFINHKALRAKKNSTKGFNKVVINLRFCLGEIPLLTKNGHFIINGCPRVVVSQLIRSPGIYYSTKLEIYKDNYTWKRYLVSFIPEKGSWLRFETDRPGRIWAKIDYLKKVPLLLFLIAIGLTTSQIDKKIPWNSSLYHLPKDYDMEFLDNQKKALIQFFGEIRPNRIANDLHALEFLDQKFFNPKFYDLGKLGRLKINQKLNLLGNLNTTVLCPEDILAATYYLIELESPKWRRRGLREVFLDDVDDLKNRRVRPVGELIQAQIRIGLTEFETRIQDQLQDKKYKQLSPNILKRIRPFERPFKKFFGSSQLSQYMDQTNPLSELTHKRRLTCLGPGGLQKSQTSLVVREIHPSHYGRLCPIETPEGINAGLVNSLTTAAKVNKNGFLITPFYKVIDGYVQKSSGLQYLTPEEEEKLVISPGDLLLSTNNKINSFEIPSRTHHEFQTSIRNEIDFISISPVQMISVATALIPFLEHDDANRALMASNMQRQAVPLMKVETPIVGTGFEAKVARDSRRALIAKKTGKVVFVNNQKIVIKHGFKSNREQSNLKIKEAIRERYSGKEPPVSIKVENELKNSKKKICYTLKQYERSNQDTCIHEKPVVKKNDFVLKGDLLADSSGTSRGEVALGKNILIAYMTWEGFNFEDAIIISDRLVHENIYTHIHFEKFDVEIRKTQNGIEEITRMFPGHQLNRSKLDQDGIIRCGAWVESGDVLVGKTTPISKTEISPAQKLLFAIFSIDIKKGPRFKDTSLRVPKGIKGRIIGVSKKDKNNSIRIYLAYKKNIQLGDKMSGRHGNKGIISKILPRQDMPFLQDGTPVDMILSPLGVPSRMNVGQILECLLGLAGKHLHQNYRLVPFDEMYGPETSRGFVYHKLYETRKITNQNWVFEPNFPGKSYIFDGRTGETFNQPVTVGYSYILKLIHLVDKKIHARATGPYSLVTQQPLRGRAKKGGQRIGEMEVWAFEAFGAAYTLQEILTLKSDDMIGRTKTYDSLVLGKSLPEPNLPESTKVLIHEIQALCIDIQLLNENEGQWLPITEAQP